MMLLFYIGLQRTVAPFRVAVKTGTPLRFSLRTSRRRTAIHTEISPPHDLSSPTVSCRARSSTRPSTSATKAPLARISLLAASLFGVASPLYFTRSPPFLFFSSTICALLAIKKAPASDEYPCAPHRARLLQPDRMRMKISPKRKIRLLRKSHLPQHSILASFLLREMRTICARFYIIHESCSIVKHKMCLFFNENSAHDLCTLPIALRALFVYNKGSIFL